MRFLDRLSMRAMGLVTDTRAPALKSERAPRGALATTQGWTMPDQPMEERYPSDRAIEKAYMGNIYVWRCVNTIANSITSCPLRAGDPVSNNYSIDTPLARLLGPAPGSPNPNMSSAILLRHAITSYILLGKAVWSIERDAANRIVGLWPLRAQHVKPVPSDRGSEYFKQFNYNNKGDRNYVEYKPDELVYMWHPSLSDFRQPEAVVNVAALNISVAKMIDTYDYHFLKNGAVPATLIVTPPFATSDEKEGFQRQFISDFSGVSNTGKTMFAERDISEGEGDVIDSIDVKQLGVNQRDAELNILRKAQNMNIAVAFGVPMSILGDSTMVTFSNSFQDRRSFWLESLLPKSREIQDGINTHLAPLLGKELAWFDVRQVPELRAEPVLPADGTTITLEGAGAFSWDEWRSERGLVSSEEAGLSKIQKEAHETVKPPDGSLSAQADPGKKPAVPPATAPVASAPAASRATTTVVAEERHPGHNHLSVPTGHLSYIEDILTSQIKNLLDDQAESTRQKLAGRRGRQGVVFDREYWRIQTERALAPTLRALGCSNIQQIVARITDDTGTLIDIALRDYPDSVSIDDLNHAIRHVLNGRSAVIAAVVLGEPQYPVADVADLLMQMSRGTIDVDGALSMLGATGEIL